MLEFINHIHIWQVTAANQQAITRANVYLDIFLHMALVGPNELSDLLSCTLQLRVITP